MFKLWRNWLNDDRITNIERIIFTIIGSVILTAIGALSLMLGLEFLNDFYTEVTGLSYMACFVIVLALRGLYWAISTDTTTWFDKAKSEL